MQFEELGLVEALLRAVSAEGYETATPIQEQAIGPVLAGRDLMGCAQTGTGKTAAFALPTLQRLCTSVSPVLASGSAEPRAHKHANGKKNKQRDGFPRADRRPIRALVLAPTRELAAQIGESFKTYGRFTGLRCAVVFGGVGQNPQVRAIEQGVDVLIATPGRLLDLMEQGHINLRNVEILILDEADQMLDMGFIVPLRRIVASVPRERQTLMFSATMPPEIRKLASEWLSDPVHVQVAPVATPAELVEHSVFFVEQQHKPQMLVHYLQNTAFTRALVFARTKHGADKVVKNLERSGIRAAAIHSNKSQTVRQRTLAAFKSNRPPVLVATDIAARGLDVDNVSHVVNYELPDVAEVYVHRIGRTGRAGATGVATSFCGGHERGQLRQIEQLTRRKLRVEQDQPEYKRVAVTHEPRESRDSSSEPVRGEAKGGVHRNARPGHTRRKKARGPKRELVGAAKSSGAPRAKTGGGNGAKRRKRNRRRAV